MIWMKPSTDKSTGFKSMASPVRCWEVLEPLHASFCITVRKAEVTVKWTFWRRSHSTNFINSGFITYENIWAIDVRRLTAAAMTAAQILDLVSFFIGDSFKSWTIRNNENTVRSYVRSNKLGNTLNGYKNGFILVRIRLWLNRTQVILFHKNKI